MMEYPVGSPEWLADQFGEPIPISSQEGSRHLQLRDYQHDALARVREAIATGQQSILLVIPTGGGKTVVAVDLIQEYASAGRPVLIVVHREELLTQMGEKLDAIGIDYGVIKAGHQPRAEAVVQIASIQTLHARAVRSARMEMPPAALVIFDEAHHSVANTWIDVADHYAKAGAIVFGMTATPCRSDGRGLGNVFQAMICGPSNSKLVADGWLVKTTVFAPFRPDLSGVRTVAGDYSESQLDERLNKQELVGDIVLHYLKLNPDRRPTVVFAVNVAHAVSIRDALRHAGVMAEVVHGGTTLEDRASVLAKLDRREIDVVVNCMVLTEGWDQPGVSCLILARPTKSLGLYRQMVGRVLRPAPGKTDALIIDHSGATYEHGFAEDDIEWALHEDQRARNRAHASRGQHTPRELKTCPECSAIRAAGEQCGNCGWKPQPKGRDVEVIDGELAKLNRDRTASKHDYTEDEKLSWHRQLTWIGQRRGYKSGWPGVQYKSKFGSWPAKRQVAPLPASDVVSRWVKSRQIAYARGMERRGQS